MPGGAVPTLGSVLAWRKKEERSSRKIGGTPPWPHVLLLHLIIPPRAAVKLRAAAPEPRRHKALVLRIRKQRRE